jgi:Fe-S-cluster containining protein
MSEVRRATLHLKVLGESQKVSVEVPPTPGGMGDLLAAARAITDATVGVAIEKSAAAGAAVSCCRGCAACCYQLVAVSVPEARALGRLVEGMPAERQAVIRERFAETARRARKMGVVDKRSVDGAPVLMLDPEKEGRERYLDLARRYYALGRACGFLENGECGIYEDRPLICREYVVSSPAAHCGELALEAIQRVEPPVKLSEGLAEITAVVEGKAVEQVPLFAAVAWAGRVENQGEAARHSGVELLKVLARWVDAKSGVPLEGRGERGSRGDGASGGE